MYEIKVDERQLATTLAALRLWQKAEQCLDGEIEEIASGGGQFGQLPFWEIEEIATGGGQFERLSFWEIEALCEELNMGEEATVGRAEPPAGGDDEDEKSTMRRYLVTGDEDSTALFESWHKEGLEALKKLKFARNIHERRMCDEARMTTYMTLDSPFPQATEEALKRVAQRTGVTLERLLGAGPTERYETLHLASHGKTWAGRPKKGRRT